MHLNLSTQHGGFHPNIKWSILIQLIRLAKGQQKLLKKSRGRLIHVSDFVNEITGRLVVRDKNGKIIKDARKVIYPGSKGDPWWDMVQLLAQVKDAIKIFEEAHPNCQVLFVFDNSSAHASLGPDALHAFDMNKSNGGKQRFQKDTIIPDSQSVPAVNMRGKPQSMKTEDGLQKGMQQVLEERGFDVSGLRAKCKPVCPFENKDCCMARLLSHQEDFANQVSMLEQVITEAGHLCLFLPKFHCELNPIEMVCNLSDSYSIIYIYSTGDGPSIATARLRKTLLIKPRQRHSTALMPAQPMSSESL